MDAIFKSGGSALRCEVACCSALPELLGAVWSALNELLEAARSTEEMHGTPGKAAQRVKARATHAQHTWMALCSRAKMLKLFVGLKFSSFSFGSVAWELWNFTLGN